MSHVLEHILSWEDVILECHRVLRPGGFLEIRVPYGITYNPYHVRHFMPSTLDPFTSPHEKGDCRQFEFERPLFELRERKVLRVFWFGWHLDRYLHVRFLNGRRYTFPFGKKWEILWKLAKPSQKV